MKIYTLVEVEMLKDGGFKICGTTTYFSTKEKLIAYLTNNGTSKGKFFSAWHKDAREGFDNFLNDNVSNTFNIKEVMPNDGLFGQFGDMEYYYLVHEHELDPVF